VDITDMPDRLLSQLAHVEILTPTLEDSLRFYTQVLGLAESDRRGDSVYLRGWGEFFHHSVQLTASDAPGLGHIGWRSDGREQLEKAVARIEETGRGEGWHEDSAGHGPAYRYRSPGGHLHEIFWEVDRYKPPPEMVSTFPNRAQRFVPRGAAARSLDHVTIASNCLQEDVDWYRETLGHRYMEYTVAEDNPDLIVFAMLTTCERGHDLGVVADFSGVPGRLNHVGFWVDQREEHRRAADVFLEADVPIEFGPGRHGMGEQDYLYAREPSGLRVELNSGGYRNYEPDWEPVGWTPAQGSNSFYRNLAMPHSMFESFPDVEVPSPRVAAARTGLFH
jgi:catechol 2,3-dioxygenase